MERQQFQYEGLRWLYEMQLINHPQVINNLKMNVLLISKSIRDVELLIDRENKKMLVYLDLSWFGRKFKKNHIFSETEIILSQLLPAFRFRIIDDPVIFNMAVEKIKKVIVGGKSELKNNANSSNSNDVSNTASSMVEGTNSNTKPINTQSGSKE
jgi:hypothetical protein